MIEVDLALLVDAANLSDDGKLNLLGEFNILLRPEPPWALVGRSLVLRLQGDALDAGPHTVGLRLLDEDRNLLWASGDNQIDFPKAMIPGLPARALTIVGLPPMVLKVEGTYLLEILVDGVARRPGVEFHCVLKKDMPNRAGS